MNIWTLVVNLSMPSGMVMAYFSIFLMAMDISGPTCLKLTNTYLAMVLQFFKKSWFDSIS